MREYELSHRARSTYSGMNDVVRWTLSSDDTIAVESQGSQSDDSPTERYTAAKQAFDALMARDFPDFTVEQYAAEKIAAEGTDAETLSAKLWAGAQSIPNRLDLTGDGKIGLDDASAAAKQAADHIGKLGTVSLRSIRTTLPMLLLQPGTQRLKSAEK